MATSARDHFSAGNLAAAIEAQLQEVRSAPLDSGRRTFLFELLAFAGDLDRAGRQIDAVNYGNMELDAAVLGYRKLLDSEQARRRLFSEGLVPRFFGDQPEHTHLRLEAVNRLREQHLAEAAETLAKASAATPQYKGELNGKPFSSLRDCDDLFAGILEVMAQGAYFWVPLEQVQRLTMNAPKFPRDLLWVPARLEMEAAAGNVFLPALYPGSHAHDNELVKLGRMTDWRSEEGGPVLGVGLRMFLADDEAVSLPEWRELVVS